MNYSEWKYNRAMNESYGAQYPTLDSAPKPPVTRRLEQQQSPAAVDPNEAFNAGYQTAMAYQGQPVIDPSMSPMPNHMEELLKMDAKRRNTKRSGFQIFSNALANTGISKALNGTLDTQMTVFAPTDDAFKIFGETDQAKFSSENPEWAESLLESHIVETEFTPEMANGQILGPGPEAPTLHGATLIRLRPRRDPSELLPSGAIPDDPLVQLVDVTTNKILAQAKITGANWMPGTGTVFSIDKLLIAPKS